MMHSGFGLRAAAVQLGTQGTEDRSRAWGGWQILGKLGSRSQWQTSAQVSDGVRRKLAGGK